ncbi:anthranilate synthase component II [Peptoniphilus asaccharolyticus]
MILMIDNYDSFTYNVVTYLNILKEEVVVKRNDEITIDEVVELNPEAIVISPGPKSPEESKISLEILKKLQGKYPILGICLGHQAFAVSRGVRVVEGTRPMHGKMSDIEHDGKGVFKGVPNPTTVMRYHSLVAEDNLFVDGEYNGMKITSKTKDGVIMGLRDESMKIETVQFHPESVGTKYGLQMIENFLAEVRNDKN